MELGLATGARITVDHLSTYSQMATIMNFEDRSYRGALELNAERLECGHCHSVCHRSRIEERRGKLIEPTLQAMVGHCSAGPERKIVVCKGTVGDAAASSPTGYDREIAMWPSITWNVNAVAAKPSSRIKYRRMDDPGFPNE
jgi:hypothetical protein